MLQEGFELSQGSLQDYVDCKRRFQLRHLHRQVWPAIEVEPALEHERYSLQGQQFHHLLERYFLLRQSMPDGEARAVVEKSIPSGDLLDWWRAFLKEPPLNLPTQYVEPEVRLAVSLAGQRMIAVFDLLAVDYGERIVIVDWKTSRRRPSREMLLARLQSKVYPVLAVEAGSQLFGQAVDPARVTMIYWFANYPAEPHVYHYSQQQYERDRLYLERLVGDVLARDFETSWDMTDQVEICRYCEYRSLCDRGIVAGADVGDFDVDFDGFSFVDEGDELEY